MLHNHHLMVLTHRLDHGLATDAFSHTVATPDIVDAFSAFLAENGLLNRFATGELVLASDFLHFFKYRTPPPLVMRCEIHDNLRQLGQDGVRLMIHGMVSR